MMTCRFLLAALLAVVVAVPCRAQDAPTDDVSWGGGLGTSADHGRQFALDLSADWQPGPLLVSVRTAGVADLLGDNVGDVGVLVGLTHGRGRWSASAGAGVGLVWVYDAPVFLSSSGDRDNTSGPYIGLPVYGEVAYRTSGQLFFRVRAFANANAAQRFAGTSLGLGLWL